jgi:hypothetical protein
MEALDKISPISILATSFTPVATVSEDSETAQRSG